MVIVVYFLISLDDKNEDVDDVIFWRWWISVGKRWRRFPSPREALSYLTVTLATFGRGPLLFSFLLSSLAPSLQLSLLLSCFRRRFRSVVISDDVHTVVTIGWRRDCGMYPV